MKDIKNLIELQKIDAQIFRLREELKQKPIEISSLEKYFSEKTLTLKKLEEELKKLQVSQKDKELELQSKEQVIEKQKSQLFQVKSNKEYTALQLEIEKMKADNSLAEEQIIVGMEKIDEMKQSVAREKNVVSQEEKKLKQDREKVELDIKEVQSNLDALSAQRKRIIESGIKPEVLALYERILENRGEMAIVSVKDDACSGCFMAIRPQVVNELRLGKMLTCDSCSRILYVENGE